MSKFVAIQMSSGPIVSANLLEAKKLIQIACADGAECIVLPENFAQMAMDDNDVFSIAEDIEQPGEILSFLSDTARELNIWLLGGTIPLRCSQSNKILSAAILFNNSGEIVARYNKIHLFDMVLSESHGVYQESSFTTPGNEVCVVDSPFGKIGIAICYDIRFPELFRRMSKLGMEILLIPASFTAITGKAHWEILTRARAIEDICYVVASGQGGYHVNGRETYGHSMIISPWGQILGQLKRTPGHVCAEIDLDYLHTTRKDFPVLNHRQMFCDFKKD